MLSAKSSTKSALLVQSIMEEGFDLCRRGDYKKAQPRFESALRQLPVDAQPVTKADIYDSLGLVSYFQGDFQNAQEFYDSALEIYNKTATPRNVAKTYSHLGALRTAQGEFDRARKDYEKALKQVRPKQATPLARLLRQGKLPAPNDQQSLFTADSFESSDGVVPGWALHARSLCGLGYISYRDGDYLAAIPFYEEAVNMYEQHDQKDLDTLLDTADAYHKMGLVLKGLGKYKEAEGCYKKALKIREDKVPESLVLAQTLHHLANVYFNQGLWDEAEYYYSKAAHIRREKAPGSLDLKETCHAIERVRQKKSSKNV